MQYKWRRKSLIFGFSTISLASVLPLTIACGQIPKNVDSYNQANGEFAKYVFLDSFFNSDALQNLQLNIEDKEITKSDVIILAKKSPLYKALDKKTKALVVNELTKIDLTKNPEGNQVIALETTLNQNKPTTFKHELITYPENIYTFDQDQKQVFIDGSQLKTINDIFQVLDDIWNIRPKYNNFTFTKKSNLYQLESPLGSNLTQAIKNNSSYQNLLGWNFDYKIVFNFANKSYTLDNKKLQGNLINLTNEIINSLNEQVIKDNYASDELKANHQQIDQWMAEQNYPNYELYPILARNESENFIFRYENEIFQGITATIFNNFIFADYARLPKEVAISAYDNINTILSTIFHSFANFSRSETFLAIINQADFDKNFFYYQDWDRTQGVLNKQNITFENLFTIPNFLVDKLTMIEIQNQNKGVLYTQDVTYLEYMFAQYIFATDELAKFQKIDFESSVNSYNQDLINNLEISYDQNKDVAYVKPLLINNLIVPQQTIAKTSVWDQHPISQLDLNQIYQSQMYLIPQYQYYFDQGAYLQESERDFYTFLAYQKTDVQKIEFYSNFDVKKTLNQSFFNFDFKNEFANLNFFDATKLDSEFNFESLFNGYLKNTSIITNNNLTWSEADKDLSMIDQIWKEINQPGYALPGQKVTKTYNLPIKYLVTLNEDVPLDINFQTIGMIGNGGTFLLNRFLNLNVNFEMQADFEYLETNEWSVTNSLLNLTVI